mmetsp:Transcript_23592/g.80432  ORF Transcript_23592/g.80432 Transcript_23592/m.80432 type:complete len:209 (+) Transcript_23592:2989-3615(+)
MLGLKVTVTAVLLCGPTVPDGGSKDTTVLPPPPRTLSSPVVNVERSKLKANGRCSLLVMYTTSLALAPTSTLLKLTAARSRLTAGSMTWPTSRNGTLMPCSAMTKRQKLSSTSSLSGVYSKIISYFLPAPIMPLRFTHRKPLATGVSVSAGSHANSYATLVGLRTKKRFVLRTLVPSDSNSTTFVAGSRVPCDPPGPGSSGLRLPAVM